MFFRSEWFHMEWPFKCVHWCDRPLRGQTSPRWCSCIWWPSRTPRHCRGTLYWSTCLWDVPVSRNTAGRVGKGGRVTLSFVHTNISAGITHHVFSPHHFHNVSAPLWEQLHALQGQVKQLPVLSVSLLGFLTPRPGHHLHQHTNKRHLRLNPHNPDFLTVQISAEKNENLQNPKY